MKTIEVILGAETRIAQLYKKKNGKRVYWSPFTGERVEISAGVMRRENKNLKLRIENEKRLCQSRKCPDRTPRSAPSTHTNAPQATLIASPCLEWWGYSRKARMNLRPVTLREANEFVEQFHRHNEPTAGGRFAIGLETDGELCGVAIVGRPIARQIEHHYTAEVLRTCTNQSAPKGAVSKLYAACWRAWRAMGGTRIITYTLTTESGASLRGAGWKVIAWVEGTNDGWGRDKRPREWQPVNGQQKLKWEVA